MLGGKNRNRQGEEGIRSKRSLRTNKEGVSTLKEGRRSRFARTRDR